MVHIYWNFDDLDNDGYKIPQITRILFVRSLNTEMNIPIGYTAGFDKPYIQIEYDENRNITKISVRHLTYQTHEYREQIESIAYKIFARYKVIQ